MRILCILILSLLLSCSPGKGLLGADPKLTSACPKNGACSVKIIPNSALLITNDEFGNHYKTEANSQKSIIIYNYSKIVKGNLQDASYREEIIFEIDNELSTKTFSNSEIQNTKMLFGRFCYCKGQTGYYKVGSGSLKINADSKVAELNFTVTEVPQIINQISISLK